MIVTFNRQDIKNGFDESLLTGTILIDLQKAFDTINDTNFYYKSIK